ncbi:hypothetical protein FQA47_021796 [Oryzias melastigma]|uniref:Uncharacterized protein n=1 Tax=Oryzias melastigma TaxID=30732 RepID=A0A834L289_ORYME|nr:hypothetical protein FQA47_021796 [Oryzias melastigma]
MLMRGAASRCCRAAGGGRADHGSASRVSARGSRPAEDRRNDRGVTLIKEAVPDPPARRAGLTERAEPAGRLLPH